MTWTSPSWTAEDEREIVDNVFGDAARMAIAINTIALKQERTPGAVLAKCHQLGIDVGSALLVTDEYSSGRNEAQDRAFQDALTAAVAAGSEHPPMLGVDRRPGTKAPRTLDSNRSHPGSSPAAQCVDL